MQIRISKQSEIPRRTKAPRTACARATSPPSQCSHRSFALTSPPASAKVTKASMASVQLHPVPLVFGGVIVFSACVIAWTLIRERRRSSRMMAAAQMLRFSFERDGRSLLKEASRKSRLCTRLCTAASRRVARRGLRCYARSG
jgi:hypothetical protein